MATFVRGANPVWLLDDLVGNLLDDTYYMFVLENYIPYIPATVFHDVSGTTPWDNPIQFLANGTLPVNIFFDPDVVYRLEIRKGDTQADALIYLIEDYSPTGGVSPVTDFAFPTTNQITNPQFSLVNFASPYTLSAVTDPEPIEFAPGWFLNLAGTGNVTFTQVVLNSATANPTNAPYAIQIALSGAWTGDPYVSQRFNKNGMLWSEKWVASSVTAKSPAPAAISASLYDSMGAKLVEVLDSVDITTAFEEYVGNGLVPATTNTDLPPNASIEYRLFIPLNVDITLSSFQLIESSLGTNYAYAQDSIARQVDQTFHYYKRPLERKPIPSYLVGWDFPLNPTQFKGTTIPVGKFAIGANKSQYVWDQTIAFQSVDSGMSVTRMPSGAIELKAELDTQMAIIQYLPEVQARELLLGNMSVNVYGYASAGIPVNITVTLAWIADATISDVGPGVNNSLVRTLDSDGGVALFAPNWLPLKNLGDATQLLSNTLNHKQFTRYSSAPPVGTGSNAATFFAIIVGTSTVRATQSVVFQSISLNRGDIPTVPAPKTLSATLADCQYYYQKSFLYGVVPANGVGTPGSSMVAQTSGPVHSGAMGPVIRYPVEMRALPVTTLFNPFPGGATGEIYNSTTTFSMTLSHTAGVSESGFIAGGTTTSASASGNTLLVNWVSDARLGIV